MEAITTLLWTWCMLLSTSLHEGGQDCVASYTQPGCLGVSISLVPMTCVAMVSQIS